MRPGLGSGAEVLVVLGGESVCDADQGLLTFVEPNGAGTGASSSQLSSGRCDGRDGMLVVARDVGSLKLE